MPVTIKDIKAREILDSRGNPTVEVKVMLSNGMHAKASVPSGASTGIHEALELRDKAKRYGGKGVQTAVKNVNDKIAPVLRKQNAYNPKKIDRVMLELDGTENKTKLGANAILGVSLATARAAARSKKKPLYEYIRSSYKLAYKNYKLPTPMMNIINGGQHATNGLDVQEYMIVPIGIGSFTEKVRAGSEVFHALKKILKDKKMSTGVGDEGGYAPEFKTNVEALEYIMKAIKSGGYKPKKQVAIAMDVAASEFYDAKKELYLMEHKSKKLSAREMDNLYKTWLKKYPIMSIEDGLDQDDWVNWVDHTKNLGKRIMLVGDDLFVTNQERLQAGIDSNVANAILIKLNQIGTLSETIETIELARANKYKTVISHRSGETCDPFIADLSVAVNSEFIKTGSLSRSERLTKYNRLMEIEMELKGKW